MFGKIYTLVFLLHLIMIRNTAHKFTEKKTWETMLIDLTREKLFNAIIYFVENTNSCRRTKLNKLLYFLDFKHYGLIGRNVTGLDYYACPEGPVPVKFYELIDAEINSAASDETPNAENGKLVKFEYKKSVSGENELLIKPLKSFNGSVFSKREKQILKELVEEYKSSYAKDMTEASHLDNSPWHEVFGVSGKKRQKIPYELALQKLEKDSVLEIIWENKKYWQNYR